MPDPVATEEENVAARCRAAVLGRSFRRQEVRSILFLFPFVVVVVVVVDLVDP